MHTGRTVLCVTCGSVRDRITNWCTKAAREVGVMGDGHGDELGESEGMRRASTVCRGAVPDAIIKGAKGARGLIGRLEGRGVGRRGWWGGREQAVTKGAPRQEDLTPESGS